MAPSRAMAIRTGACCCATEEIDPKSHVSLDISHTGQAHALRNSLDTLLIWGAGGRGGSPQHKVLRKQNDSS